MTLGYYKLACSRFYVCEGIGGGALIGLDLFGFMCVGVCLGTYVSLEGREENEFRTFSSILLL